MTEEERIAVAAAARRVLAQQLQRKPYIPGFAKMAIESFMHAYDVDAIASRPLLEHLLDRQHLAEYGRYELPHLAHAINKVHDADALSLIYRVLFSDVNVGTGSVALGPPSVGLNLTQDAAQSLSTSQYALAQHFGAFLDEHPAAAIGALASALNFSLHSNRFGSGTPFSLTINGCAVEIAHDLSQFDDQSYHHHDDWWTMVSVFEERLRASLAAADRTLFDVALEVIPSETTGSFLWRVLLRVSGVNATSAAVMLPFVSTRRVFESSEFGSPLRDYLAAAFPSFGEEARQSVLATFLECVMDDGEDVVKHARRNRVREFVAALPAGTVEQHHPLAVALGADANTVERNAENDDEASDLALNGFHMGGGTFRRVALSEAAHEAGASVELVAEIDALDPYIHQNPRNITLLPRPFVDVIEALDRLSRTSPPAARRATLEVMWMVMRDALGQQVELTPATLRDWQAIALEMIAEPSPEWNDEERGQHERRYAEHSYLTTRARNEGVEILYILFSRNPAGAILEALRPLADDTDPAMRADVAHGARFALRAAPDEAWDIIERGFADPNAGVWVSAFSTTRYAPSSRQDRVHAMYVEAFSRIEQIEKRNDLCIELVRSAVELAFQFNNADAREQLAEVVDHPWEFRRTASSLVFELANTVAAPNAQWEKRVWAADQLLRLVVRLVDEAERLQQLHGFDVNAYPSTEQDRARAVLKLLHDASERLYYSSQIEQRITPNGPFDNTGRLSPRSYALLRPLIVALRRFPFAYVSYNVIKLLWGAIDVDPRDVLLLGCSAINNGAQGALAGDAQAEDDMRAFVMRYVQHHRGLLEGDRESLAAIMDVVDVFVSAGWPKWIGIVAELDGIYRSS